MRHFDKVAIQHNGSSVNGYSTVNNCQIENIYEERPETRPLSVFLEGSRSIMFHC